MPIHPAVPAPLQRLGEAIAAKFPGAARIESVALNEPPGEHGIVISPLNPRGASIFVTYTGPGFYVEVAGVDSAESADEVPDDEAFAWAVDRISCAAEFGAFSIIRRGRWWASPSTSAVLLESAEDVASFTLGPNETLRRHYEPW